jgi:general secretion pathway protein A
VAAIGSAVWYGLSHDGGPTAQVLSTRQDSPDLSLIERPVVQKPSQTDQGSGIDKLKINGLHAKVDLEHPGPMSPEQALAKVQQHYFSIWGKQLGPGVKNVCMRAREYELRCLQGVVGWEGLERLNRPVILMLKESDTEYPLLVKKADGDRLLVDDGQAEAWVSLEEIKALWQGDFTMLWRPTLDIPLLGPGSTGEAVTWLRERLALADGEPVAAAIGGEDQFDDNLQQRLQRFQRANGLNADGIAGPWTMILLNNLQLPPETPTLEVGG